MADDRGQSLIWVAGLVILVAALCLGASRAAARAQAMARVDAVADLTALAGAVRGGDGADEVARANGARVTSLAVDGSVVTVGVELAGHRAVALATGAPDADDQR